MITYKSDMIPNSYRRYTYLRYTMSLHNSNLFLKFEFYMNFRIFTHAHAIYINLRRLIRWPVIIIPGHMIIVSLMTHLRITTRIRLSGALRDEWKWIKMNYLVLIKIFIEKYTFIFINMHASDLIRNIKLITHMTRNIVNRCVIVKNSVNHALSFLIVCASINRIFLNYHSELIRVHSVQIKFV